MAAHALSLVPVSAWTPDRRRPPLRLTCGPTNQVAAALTSRPGEGARGKHRSAGTPRGRSPNRHAEPCAGRRVHAAGERVDVGQLRVLAVCSVHGQPPRRRSRRCWSCAVLVAVTSTVPRQGHARPTAREVGFTVLVPVAFGGHGASAGPRPASCPGLRETLPRRSRSSAVGGQGRRRRPNPAAAGSLTPCTTRRRLRMGGRLRLYRVPKPVQRRPPAQPAPNGRSRTGVAGQVQGAAVRSQWALPIPAQKGRGLVGMPLRLGGAGSHLSKAEQDEPG